METTNAISIEFVDLSLIIDNKYQPRSTDDPAHIEALARSIAEDDLLQRPKAHKIFNGCYELAFGHSRRKAFEWLQQHYGELGLADRYDGYTRMPLEVVPEIADEDLFGFALAENIQRKDLSPIELADAMKRYMEEFNKTSVECGERFNCSPEKVRSTVRLLNLPVDLQQGVADGTITQNNARRLLTIQRVAPDQVKSVASQLKHEDVDPDKIIGETLTNSSTTVKMWERWQSGDPLAGSRLWKLYMPGDKFPNDLLPELKAGDVSKALDIEKDADLEKWIDALWDGYWHGPDGIPEGPAQGVTVAEHFISRGAPVDVIEKITHLLRPPGCSACPFYAKVDGNHYCTFKACYNRKVRAWEEHTLTTACQKLKIVAYNKRADGDCHTISQYEDAEKKLFETRDPGLRLKKGTNWNQRFEGVPEGYMVVVIGEALQKLRGARKENSVNREEHNENYHRDQRRLAKIRDANQAALYEFIWNVLTPVFQPVVFNGSGCLGFYEAFADRFCSGVPAEEPDKKAKKADRIDFYQKSILFAIFDDDLWEFITNQKNEAVRSFAKHIQGVARTWGVALPKDWMQKAREADEAVTVETGEEEK